MNAMLANIGAPPPLPASLWCIAAFLALCPLALFTYRSKLSNALVYGLAFSVAALLAGSGATHLLRGDAPSELTLPLGLPWLGAHFRLDALSAAFLVIVNLGSAAAAWFALGYG